MSLELVPDVLRERAAAALAERDWLGLTGYVGNEARPALVYGLWDEGAVTAADLASGLLLEAWEAGPHYRHLDCLGLDRWLELFEEAGWVSDGAPRPTASLRAWRGAPLAASSPGMSWSTSKEKAEWFRNRWTTAGIPSGLYVVTADPAAMLGMTNQRGEHELILDARRIRPDLCA